MITVVGVAMDGGVGAAGRAAIVGAELLIGGTRLLQPYPNAQTWDLTGRMSELRPLLQRNMDRAVVVLASGDPLLYGIGSFLSRHFPDVRYLSAPSSAAEAFARAGLSWEDARVLSVHGRPMADIGAALDQTPKLAIFTDEVNTPAAVGRQLGDRIGTAWVCERLGEPEERVRRVSFHELAAIEADPLNVVVLHGQAAVAAPTIPYIADDDFEKKMPRKGLITKREVRTLSLAALGLRPGDVAWDIGAGSGAVAIEMALLGASEVHAIEKNADGCAIIEENLSRFHARQVRVHHARAPEGLEALPSPDRVFIGGTGGDMAGLLALCFRRLRPSGRVVANVATLENLAEVVAFARSSGARWGCTQVQIARAAPILDLTRLEALNPVWILTLEPAP